MPHAPTVRTSSYRWLVFGLLAGAYFMVYFHRTSPAVVALEMAADLGTGMALLGLLASAYFYPYALMQIPAGLLADSWGPRKTIILFFALAGAASIAFGLVGSVGGAIAARVAVGLGVSTVLVPTMKILTRWFKPSEFATMMGLLMAIGGLGILFSAAPLAYLSTVLGWRGAFMAIGVLTLILTAGMVIWVRNRPEDVGLEPVVKIDPAAQAEDKISLRAGLKMVLNHPRFWALAGWNFFAFGIFFSVGGLWAGPYLRHVYGLSQGQAGRVISLLAVGMIVGSPTISYLSDRVFHSRKIIIVGTSIILVILTLPLAFFPDSLSLTAWYFWFFLLGVFPGASVVVAFTTTKELFPLSIAGTSTGLVNIFPFLGGAVLQVLVGLRLEGQGPAVAVYSPQAYGRAFLVFFIAALIALAASFGIKETMAGQGASSRKPA